MWRRGSGDEWERVVQRRVRRVVKAANSSEQ
jgi:hypothetical protein